MPPTLLIITLSALVLCALTANIFTYTSADGKVEEKLMDEKAREAPNSERAFHSDELQTVFEWKQLEYDFPSKQVQQQAISSGQLVQENGVPVDVAPWYNHQGKLKVFTTVPRGKTGVPYSLATITQRTGPAGPLLQAYPSYEWHSSNGTDCDGITSAFHVAITPCNQMWVIDSGTIGDKQLCAPQLLLFDLNTDTLLHRYRFPAKLYTPTVSMLISPVVNVRDPAPHGRCQNAMIYVADVTMHGLVIYDQQRDKAWRAEHKFMYRNPIYGTHTVAGESFDLMDGIFGMSTDGKNLYFHPLASISEFMVPLSVLDNELNWNNGTSAISNEFKLLGNRGSQCAAEAVDSRANIYCVTLNSIALFRWNVNTSYGQEHFQELSANPKMLEFVSGMKVLRDLEGKKEELWMVSCSFQRITTGALNPEKINFRIVKRVIEGGAHAH